jgi:hypothetical protein
MDSVIKMTSNDFGATRITWQQNILSNISLFQMQVVL